MYAATLAPHHGLCFTRYTYHSLLYLYTSIVLHMYTCMQYAWHYLPDMPEPTPVLLNNSWQNPGSALQYPGNTTLHPRSSLCLPALQLSTYVSFWTADKFGRRALFLQAGVQMSAALLVIAISLKCLGGGQGTWLAWYILAMTCVYDM